jgi:hypothetical protein
MRRTAHGLDPLNLVPATMSRSMETNPANLQAERVPMEMGSRMGLHREMRKESVK